VNQAQGNLQLNQMYEISFPGGLLDSSWLSALNAGQDSLADNLGSLPLTGPGTDSLLPVVDSLNNLFDQNLDSLDGLYGQYQDSLSFDSANWNVNIIGFDSLNQLHLGVLQDSLDLAMDADSTNGSISFPDILDKLFDETLFPDIELAYGEQQASLKYWNDEYAISAFVIRVGSVPRFDREVPDVREPPLPIEPRWHAQASWLKRSLEDYLLDPENKFGQPEEGFHPLLLRGDYAMMATPRIGRWGNTSFRMISSLGLEFGTYAPAHRDYAPPLTTYNVGFATGFGPQVGGGFAMTTGQLVIYSLTTACYGKTLGSKYDYLSRQIETGMRFGNVINVRYSTGHISWQELDNRRASIRHQLTVGIIL
jgi:hypothetical protein